LGILVLLLVVMKPTIRSMKIREAKNFLVQQTVEQAQQDNVPLSELEKRMMYFTEGKGALEDPALLNDEFEKQYDTANYEKKISLLMRHAYARIKKEDPQKAFLWNSALDTLRTGDHYILVLSGPVSTHSSSRNRRIYLASGLLIGLPFAAILLFAHFFFPTRSGVWRYSNYIPLVDPQGSAGSIFVAGGYLCFLPATHN
jgi:hypothetical protein